MSPPAFERAGGRKQQKKQKKQKENTAKKKNTLEAASEGGVEGTGKRCAAAAGLSLIHI